MWRAGCRRASQRSISVGEGGAPPTTQVTACSSGAASACASSEISTVGAAQRCVAPARSSRQTARLGPRQHHARGADARDRPAEAPAVAVEHGQRPEIACCRARGASRRGRRARRDRRRGACRRRPSACPSCHSCSRPRSADPRCRASPAASGRARSAAPRTRRPVARRAGRAARGLARRGLELRVEQQHLRAAVLDDEAHLGRGEARVDGAQRAARRPGRRNAPPAARAG